MGSSDPSATAIQLCGALVVCLVLGPLPTISAIRVIRDPSRVKEPSLVNWMIRTGVERHYLAPGNIRFYAWMTLLMALAIDLLGAVALLSLIGIIP